MSFLASTEIRIPKPITDSDGNVCYPARITRPDGSSWLTVFAADPTDPEDYDTGEYFKAGMFGTLKDGVIEVSEADWCAFNHPVDPEDDDYTPIFVNSGPNQTSR